MVRPVGAEPVVAPSSVAQRGGMRSWWVEVWRASWCGRNEGQAWSGQSLESKNAFNVAPEVGTRFGAQKWVPDLVPRSGYQIWFPEVGTRFGPQKWVPELVLEVPRNVEMEPMFGSNTCAHCGWNSAHQLDILARPA